MVSDVVARSSLGRHRTARRCEPAPGISANLMGSQLPLLAPWTALLTVQVTVYRSVRNGVQTWVASSECPFGPLHCVVRLPLQTSDDTLLRFDEMLAHHRLCPVGVPGIDRSEQAGVEVQS